MAWDSTKTYISQVMLPGMTPGVDAPYYIKDADARAAIDLLSNATHFLGVTNDTLSDGGHTDSITIGSKTYALNPTSGQEQLVNGDIVISTASESSVLNTDNDGTEFICVIEGTPATITWYKFGSAKLNDLGDLAYKDTASGTTEKADLDASTIPVVLGAESVDGATKITTITSTSDVNVPTGITYDKFSIATIPNVKLSSATVTVKDDAKFTGTLASGTVLTGITGGVGQLNSTATVVSLTTDNNGVALVTGYSDSTSSYTTTGFSASVSSTTIYGLDSNASTTYMTGAEVINPTWLNAVSSVTLTSASTTTNNVTIASVANETLTIAALNIAAPATSVLSSGTTLTPGGSTTRTEYTVGAAGALNSFTSATVAVPKLATTSYAVTIPASTYISDVTALVAASAAVDISVTGSAVVTSDVTLGTFSDVTITTSAANFVTANATISDSTAIKAPVTVAESYATVSAYAGGSHTHNVTVS